MKSELQDKLLKKYSAFFSKSVKIYNEDNFGEIFTQETLVQPIQFGFEVGDGWYILLDTLMAQIKNHIWNVERNTNGSIKNKFIDNLVRSLRYRTSRRNKLAKFIGKLIQKLAPKVHDYKMPFEITQVKEKFAGLRFYYNGGDQVIEGMVDLAESISYQICEFCGSTVDIGQTTGYYITMCKKCYAENSKINKMYHWEQHKKLP